MQRSEFINHLYSVHVLLSELGTTDDLTALDRRFECLPPVRASLRSYIFRWMGLVFEPQRVLVLLVPRTLPPSRIMFGIWLKTRWGKGTWD